MTRTEHWATREFHDFLLKRSQDPFAWGTNDCAMFTADGIHSFTGVDIAADFRGKYTNELGSLKTIKTVTGGSTIADAVAHCAKQHDLPSLPSPLMAQRGDLVLVKEGDNLICGLVHLNGSEVVSVGQEGILRKPITDVTHAWRV